MDQRGLFARAIQDFHHARSQAALEQLTARLTRRSAELLSFEEVRQKLDLTPSGVRKVENIPLDAIVGSVGRYADFTRSYWPVDGTDEQRWASVKMAITDMSGVPPIEVYQIGEVYFVRDGNHRVSVFREMGATEIQAYVTKLATQVPISPDDDIDDIITKAERTKFLTNTQLDQHRPAANIQLSVPGAYKDIQEHIQIYQQYLSQAQKRAFSLPEAAVEWYDHYYCVVVNAINRFGMRRDFPGHTEGDIYMRVWAHRGQVMKETQINVSVDWVAQDLAAQKGVSAEKILARIFKNIIPADLSAGPAAGSWRERIARLEHKQGHLFGYILVSLGRNQDRLKALQQALIIAQKERATLYGLHVLAPGSTPESPIEREIKTSFEALCAAQAVEGYFSFAEGQIVHQIIARAHWTDLVVATLAHPPDKSRLNKFSPGFDTLIRSCTSPVLAVSGAPSHFQRALVAYDGSPKAREALFIAVYMAHRWHTALVILTVLDNGKPSQAELDDMRKYLAKNEIQPTYIQGTAPVPDAILQTVDDLNCDLILIGGYGKIPVLERLLGSTVDEVLRISRVPILVCR
jgi:nucleotide-binding universal stress UspA family protein